MEIFGLCCNGGRSCGAIKPNSAKNKIWNATKGFIGGLSNVESLSPVY